MNPEHSGKKFQRGGGRMRRRGYAALRALSLAAVGCAILPATTAGVHGDVPEKVYTYSVQHPTHGDIGTYRNSIVDSGAQLVVRNEIRVQVKVLVVVVHEEASDSRETWRRGRLVSFSGVTQENGKKTAVTGEAEGSKFVVETPQGPKEAPASVYPSNPWSTAILKAKILLGTKSGNLYRVHTGAGEPRDVVVGGKTVPTEYFKVDGDARYELWFDERGIAVKFTEIDKNGVITFNLVEESVQPANASAATSAPRG
jgi:hypothetical protein